MTTITHIKLPFVLNMKIIIFLLFLLSCVHNSFSQTNSSYRRDSLRKTVSIGGSFFDFTISAYVVNKAKATPLSGAYHLKTIYMYGFEGGPDYYFNINNSYSIIIGLHFVAAETNYKLFISKSDFNPNLNFDVNDDGQLTSEWDFYMSLPIWIQKRWFTKNNSFWNVVAGVNIRYYPIRYYRNVIEEDYPNVDGNTVNVLTIDDLIGNNLRPWINYNIGGGYSLLLRNNNYLQCNVVANFSNKKIIDGAYQINVTGKPQSTGTYSADLSYVGLSFSYIFTGANKRMRKLYESKFK